MTVPPEPIGSILRPLELSRVLDDLRPTGSERGELLTAACGHEDAEHRLAESLTLRFTRELVRAVAPVEVATIVCKWARELMQADGAAFLQREGEVVHYVAEDAIGPLWRGQRFPIGACISGWAMLNRETVAVDDVDADERVPVEAYRPPFVKALLMVPVREIGVPTSAEGPAAAIGVYWGRRHKASQHQAGLLEAVADAAAVALARARLHIDLQEARSQAEAANRAKDEFIATISHELRTPLTSIVGWVRMLHAGKMDPARDRHALDVIARSARIQIQLVDDLLDVSRMASGRLTVELEPVDLLAIVETAVEAARPAADEKGIQLERALDPRIRPVSGDAGRLQQVVTNLLANAIKFTPNGGRIEVRLQLVGSWVEIRVTDTGAGISPEFLPHVFERFSQADGATARRQGGLGLGLAIVRHLVELHGGSVHAASTGKGQGATFTVRLPADGQRRAAGADG